MVDAMSSFGAIPLDMETAGVDFLVSSVNKCLEGVPGFSYVIARLNKLLQCKGNSLLLQETFNQVLRIPATLDWTFLCLHVLLLLQ